MRLNRFTIGTTLALCLVAFYVVLLNLKPVVGSNPRTVFTLILAGLSLPLCMTIMAKTIKLKDGSRAALAEHKNEIILGSSLIFFLDASVIYNAFAPFFNLVPI